MANESIALRESRPSDTRDVEPQHHSEEDVATSNMDQADDRRHWESKSKRACVLAGSAILQLPIWGFAMSYGVFQEYYSDNWTLQGRQGATGMIGTTSNGVMYLSMPFLFALFTRRWAQYRQIASVCGAVLMGISFIASSFSTHVWHLIATQGVLAALGCTLIFSPTTLSLGEWFRTSNRAVAYGITLSCKNIVGSVCPFLFRVLLDRYDFRTALRIWAGLAVATGVLAIFLIPTHPSSLSLSLSSPADTDTMENTTHRSRKIPWHFLSHRTFWVYAVAIVLQSSGYGIPQTYLSTYAREVTLVSQTSATLLLTIFNFPGIVSSYCFGYLSDNKRFPLSATTVTAVSAVSSALSAFLFWGFAASRSPGSGSGSGGGSGMALLFLFSTTFGFFAGGYSATWGGVINEMEREAARRNEAIDAGMVYGLLNGARGIGYVAGGLVGVPLLQVGSKTLSGGFAYGTSYGPLIIFTGLSSVFGGWGLLWKWRRLPFFEVI